MRRRLFLPSLFLFFFASFTFSQEQTEEDRLSLVLYSYFESLSEQHQICQEQTSSLLSHLFSSLQTPARHSLIQKLRIIQTGRGELFSKSDIDLFEAELVREKYTLDAFYSFCADCFTTTSKYNSLVADQSVDPGENCLPFDPERLAELAFYRLSPGEVVAEIGAGDGCNTEILSLAFPKNQFFVNELPGRQIEILQRQFGNSPNVTIIQGESTSCGLEDRELDKLIVRNSIHHFDHKIEMLDSIFDALKKGGSLIVLEHFAGPNEFPCLDAMERNTFLDLMEARGFHLIRNQAIYDGSEILEFIAGD